MRILVAHVGYVQRGGEDAVVETEVRLARQAGHEVSTLMVSSERFFRLPKTDQLGVVARMGTHSYGRRLVREAIESANPDVVHFHNLYPLLGPGAVQEASELGCATVQTFHNYRLSCIAGTHFRAGAVCERCMPGRLGGGVVRGCYRASRLQSAAMADGVLRQWRLLCNARIPDVGVCLTDFMRDRLIGLGAPADALVVKPNSVEASQRVAGWGEREGALFVGRLSPEKGITELILAWPRHAPTLTVIGSGPLLSRARDTAASNVRVLGGIPGDAVRFHLAAARVCVVPSTWFEGLPTVVLEAFAEGTPVVGFALGALNGVLAHQGPRMIAGSGDFGELCDMAAALAQASEGEWTAVSSEARSVHASEYGHASNVASLGALYRLASGRAERCRE